METKEEDLTLLKFELCLSYFFFWSYVTFVWLKENSFCPFFIHIESLVLTLSWHSPGFSFCFSVTFFSVLYCSFILLLHPVTLLCYFELIVTVLITIFWINSIPNSLLLTANNITVGWWWWWFSASLAARLISVHHFGPDWNILSHSLECFVNK